MTSKQLQQLDQRLKQWRAQHADTACVRAAYRERVLKFTPSSMALENGPINPQRLAELLNQTARQSD